MADALLDEFNQIGYSSPSRSIGEGKRWGGHRKNGHEHYNFIFSDIIPFSSFIERLRHFRSPKRALAL